MKRLFQCTHAMPRALANIFTIALISCALTAPCIAQYPAAAPPASSSSSAAATTQHTPVVQSAFTTSSVTEFDVNGLKVLIKRRAGSQTISAGLFLRGGTNNLTRANQGIESLMLAAATESSARYPRERLRTELARMSTSIGFDTEFDFSSLTFATTRENFDRSWDIFTDVALRPTFDPEDVRLMQERILSGLREEQTTPDSYLQLLQEQVAYANHPYANRARGTIESVQSLKVEDVRRYHKAAMQTSRLLLVVVGDLDAAALRARIESTFGRLPRGNYAPPTSAPLVFTEPTFEVISRQLPTNYVQGVFTAPAPTSDDIYAMRVATVLLRDRVFSEVRVRRNLSYAPNAFLNNQGTNIGGIYVTAVDANQAVGVMLDEVARLQRNAVEPNEISAVIALFLTTYYLGQETNAAQVSELGTYELIGGGWRKSFEVLERLRSVSPADVRRVARTYMRNMRFVAIGDPAKLDKTIFTNANRAPVDASDALKSLGVGGSK
jgi:zinc protease